MAAGFIHDKLEIKFLILYIAARVSEPLPPEGISCSETPRTRGPVQQSTYPENGTIRSPASKRNGKCGSKPTV